jgi:predicted ATPase with chaperone activity
MKRKCFSQKNQGLFAKSLSVRKCFLEVSCNAQSTAIPAGIASICNAADHFEVPALSASVLAAAAEGDTSEQVAQRVAHQSLQLARQGCLNAGLRGPALDAHCAVEGRAAEFLHATCNRLGWSARSYQRVLRIARTVADLKAEAPLSIEDLAEAIQYRRALKS